MWFDGKCNKKYFVLCTLFACVFINGCSQKDLTLSHKYSDHGFNKQNKAVVIMKIVQPVKSIFNINSEYGAGFRLIKLNDNSFYNSKRESYYMPAYGDSFWGINTNYSDRIAMVNPGIYYIDNIRWSDGAFEYFSRSAGLSPKGIVVYGAFEVKPGDVAHVGKLLISSDTIILTKTDDLNNVKNDLSKANKHDLNQKIKSVEFYGRGSVVKRNDNGTFSIHQTTYTK